MQRERTRAILGWRTDTDEGEADSQRPSIYSAQPRDADTLQRLLTSSWWGRDGGCHGEVAEFWCNYGGKRVFIQKWFSSTLKYTWDIMMTGKEDVCAHWFVSQWKHGIMPVSLPTAGRPFLLVWASICLRRQEWPLHHRPSFYRNRPEPKCLFALIVL